MSRTVSVRLTDGQIRALQEWAVGSLHVAPQLGKKDKHAVVIVSALQKLVAALGD